jgi:hypothetical protein
MRREAFCSCDSLRVNRFRETLIDFAAILG